LDFASFKLGNPNLVLPNFNLFLFCFLEWVPFRWHFELYMLEGFELEWMHHLWETQWVKTKTERFIIYWKPIGWKHNWVEWVCNPLDTHWMKRVHNPMDEIHNQVGALYVGNPLDENHN
jgi:hypothetical protein